MDSISQQKEYWFNLIVDYLADSLPASSRVELEKWIAASEENYDYFKELKSIWQIISVTEKMSDFDSNKAYLLFKERVLMETRAKKKLYTIRHIMFRVAMIIPFFIMGYFVIAYFIQTDSDYANSIAKIEVPNGSKSQIKLIDGTKVWLNAGSNLKLNADFGDKRREVILYGEASFEVARNEEVPFIVKAGQVDVKVLGTSFNVNTYQENGVIKVALLRGAVELLSEQGEVVKLSPNELAVYDISSGKISTCEIDVEEVLGWWENKLIFKGETFMQIAGILERAYNVNIHIHNKELKKRRFVGDFVNNNSIEQIMEVISTRENFTYKIKENQIDIY